MNRFIQRFARRDFARREEGVAAIEYAFFVPILCYLMVGLVDYGMYIHAKMTLQELSFAATQYVVQGGNPDDITVNVLEGSSVYAVAEADGREIIATPLRECECAEGVAVSCSGECGEGDYIRTFYSVGIESTYTPILSYPGFSGTVLLRGYSRLQYNG